VNGFAFNQIHNKKWLLTSVGYVQPKRQT